MEGFVVRAAPVSCTTAMLKQDKRGNVNLSGICYLLTTALDFPEEERMM